MDIIQQGLVDPKPQTFSSSFRYADTEIDKYNKQHPSNYSFPVSL